MFYYTPPREEGLLMSKIRARILGLLLAFVLIVPFAGNTSISAAEAECPNQPACICDYVPTKTRNIDDDEIKPTPITP